MKAHLETGEHVISIPCNSAMNSISWNPKEYLLAFAGDDKDYNKDKGSIHIFGVNQRNRH